MKKALIVGINHYKNVSCLHGCVNDAYLVKSALDTNFDWTRNFSTKLLTAVSDTQLVDKNTLKDNIKELFEGDNDISLLYFSWHWYIESSWWYLVTSECSRWDDGLSLTELMTMVNNSSVKNKIVILDCCHSWILGNTNTPVASNFAHINEWVTILTASTQEQYAIESNGVWLFTSLLVDWLNWGASNLLWDITPWSIYAYIDQSLWPWSQRPMFKTNVKNFTVIRKANPAITLNCLKEIVNLFPNIWEEHKLDPSYEPSEKDHYIEENWEKFRILQKFNRVNLVVPVDDEHMYYAAINSKSCKLTVLWEFYWKLVKNEII